MCVAMAESGADIVSIHLPGDPAQNALEDAVGALGRKITGFECNVGDSAEIRAAFQSIWRAGVVPDIFLNCAGLVRIGPVQEMTDDIIDLVGGHLALDQDQEPTCVMHVHLLTYTPDSFRQPERLLCCRTGIRDAVD